MQFEEYIITSIICELPDIYTIRVKPKKSNQLRYKPGQFYHIKNPTFHQSHITRPLSIITTPTQQEYLEFCIKVYGDWSKALIQKSPGENLWLFGPMGVFTFDTSMTDIVCIAAGIGITPFISLFTHLQETHASQSVTLLYANKFPRTIAKRKQIESMFTQKMNWKYVPIVSNISLQEEWDGYKGRIALEILRNEINFAKNNTFFICGSPDFTNHIIDLLQSLQVDKKQIKQEIFLGHV